MRGRIGLVGMLWVAACGGTPSSQGAEPAEAKAEAKADVKAEAKADVKTDAKPTPAEAETKSADAKEVPKADATAVEGGTPAPAAVGVERCAVVDDTRSVSIRSQGGHAAAVHDLRIDIATRTLSGSSFRLDGSNPVPLTVNRTLSAEELDPLLAKLRTICGKTKATDAPEHAAPGGSSRYAVIDADGRALVLAYGQAANIAVGETVLELDREQFKALGELWPEATPEE